MRRSGSLDQPTMGASLPNLNPAITFEGGQNLRGFGHVGGATVSQALDSCPSPLSPGRAPWVGSAR